METEIVIALIGAGVLILALLGWLLARAQRSKSDRRLQERRDEAAEHRHHARIEHAEADQLQAEADERVAHSRRQAAIAEREAAEAGRDAARADALRDEAEERRQKADRLDPRTSEATDDRRGREQHDANQR